MITLRKANERLHHQRRQQDGWRTFFAPKRALPFADGFGILEVFNEDRLPPGAAFSYRPALDAELITYVCEGALAYQDLPGVGGVIRAGEFQRRNVRGGSRCCDANALRSGRVHAFQIGLRSTGTEPAPQSELKRFSVAERRGGLRIVASPDARMGSLRLRGNALVYSAMVVAGQHLVHQLRSGCSAWLHVVHGEVVLSDEILTTGDGVGISAVRGISLTAQTPTELLLVELVGPRGVASERTGPANLAEPRRRIELCP